MVVLVFYFLIIFSLVFLYEKNKKQTSESFLVANRNVGGKFGAMSIAASWIWAPAIFVSTEVGYRWGYSALVWFVIPNMLSLVLFALIAPKILDKIPKGFSYIQFLKDKIHHLEILNLLFNLSCKL